MVEVKFQSVSSFFGRMHLVALTCAGWLCFPFQCTLTSAPVTPPSRREHAHAFTGFSAEHNKYLGG